MANPATIADPGIQATALQEKRAARAWREIAARYHTGQVWRPIAQLVVTLIPLFAILIAMYFSLGVSYFLTLALAPFGGAFLLRTFVLMHDCAHNSFFPSRRANEIVGAITGVMSLTPFGLWRRDHALHHASSGDLDRRGHGDIRTLTVRE
ncbi:MAG: fatty acid desaturase, partial [Gemmatimonadaceae bacterium]